MRRICGEPGLGRVVSLRASLPAIAFLPITALNDDGGDGGRRNRVASLRAKGTTGK